MISAVAAALLINYFFVDPLHTLTIADPDQAVALVVFVAVAALVSGAVEIAVRRAQAAERARAEAETLSALAGPDLDGEESLHDVLRQRAEDVQDGVRSPLKVREPGSSEWIDADHVGWAPPGRRRRCGSTSRRAHASAWSAVARPCSPRTSASSRRSRRRPGPPMKDSASAARPRRRATSPPSTSSARRCWPRSATTCAPLWPGSRRASARLRQTDVDWSRRGARGAAGDDRGLDRPARRGRPQPPRRQPASGRSLLTVRTEAVALDQVVSSAALDLPEAADQLEIDVPEDLPLVQADPGLLQRVFVNVLDNAVRHGGSNEPIAVTARAGGETPRSRSSTTARACPRTPGASCSSRSAASATAASRGSGSGSRSRAASSRRWAARMVADTTPGGGMTMRIRLELDEAQRRTPTSP